MNRRIDILTQEQKGLKRELESYDSVVKSFTRVLGAAKAVVTKFESQPTENREKLDSAKRKLETAQQDYVRSSTNYYRVIEALRQNNIELKQAEAEKVNMNTHRAFRR